MNAFYHLIGVSGFFFVALLAGASPAMAEGQKLGDVITSVTAATKNFPDLLTAFAYLLGLFFAISGIFKFKDHVDSPQQQPLSAGVKRFIAGGALFSGPYVAEVLQKTLTGGGGDGLSATSRHGAPSGGGMDQMIVDFITNIAGPTELLLQLFVYISGVILLLVGVNRLTKTAQEGPRGPGGLGTIMTFLAAGAMFSSGSMMGAFSSSLFGDASVSTYAEISSDVIKDSGDQAKIAAVVESLMAFVMIVGYIAFIRGWFVLKSFADGNQGVSLAQALTFLIGGALAINLGELVNVLQKTVGVGGITFG